MSVPEKLTFDKFPCVPMRPVATAGFVPVNKAPVIEELFSDPLLNDHSILSAFVPTKVKSVIKGNEHEL